MNDYSRCRSKIENNGSICHNRVLVCNWPWSIPITLSSTETLFPKYKYPPTFQSENIYYRQMDSRNSGIFNI